jgi:hypothetical protein
MQQPSLRWSEVLVTLSGSTALSLVDGLTRGLDLILQAEQQAAHNACTTTVDATLTAVAVALSQSLAQLPDALRLTPTNWLQSAGGLIPQVPWHTFLGTYLPREADTLRGWLVLSASHARAAAAAVRADDHTLAVIGEISTTQRMVGCLQRALHTQRLV